MKTYLFITITTVKPFDEGKWWIHDKLISNMYIQANNLDEALKKYQQKTEEDYEVTISNNALKNKFDMYIDDEDGNPVQIGYVITGKTPFYNNNKWIDKYIDLWVEIQQVINPFTKEEKHHEDYRDSYI